MASSFVHADRIDPERYFFIVLGFVLKQPPTLMASDVFKFIINVNLNTITPRQVYSSTQTVPCHSFFQDGQFLKTLLSRIHICIEFVEEITQEITSCVKKLFQVDGVNSLSSPSLESQHREIPLWLTITLFHNGLLTMEPSRQGPTMDPASMDVIQPSLKKSTAVAESVTECCPICKESLDANVECSTTPCHHVFHHPCIVSWLQIKLVCPMCRYSLPTLEN